MFVKDSLREVKQAEFEVMLRFRKLKRNDEVFRSKLTKERIKFTNPILRYKLDQLQLQRPRHDSDSPRSTDTDKGPPQRKKDTKLVLSFFERTAPIPKQEPLPYDQYIETLLKQRTCRPIDAEQAVSKLHRLRRRYPNVLRDLEKRRKKHDHLSGKVPLLDSTTKHRCSFSLAETFYSAQPSAPDCLRSCCVKFQEQRTKQRDYNIEHYFRPKTQSPLTFDSLHYRTQGESFDRTLQSRFSSVDASSPTRARTVKRKYPRAFMQTPATTKNQTQTIMSPIFDCEKDETMEETTSTLASRPPLVESPPVMEIQLRESIELEVSTESPVSPPAITKRPLSLSRPRNFNTRLL
jgi:hypothetical protein